MKTILLNIAPDPGHEARLAAAIALAKSRGGHVTCLQVIIPPIAAGDPMTPVVVTEAIEAMEKVARKLQDETEIRLEQAEVRWTWVSEIGNAAVELVRYSRLADWIVLSEGFHPAVGSVVLHARTPVYAVSERTQEIRPEAPVLIAWNGSHPSANAMRMAVPMLRSVEAVHILAVDRDDGQFSATRASEYLSRNAIKSEVHLTHRDGKPVAQAILTFTRLVEAGMIVAGAFGHSRIREMLLGGVTRGLLKESELPLFLAH
jgi:nucleotide-binding universal stress UspA family protein